jgi:hypothetical protein
MKVRLLLAATLLPFVAQAPLHAPSEAPRAYLGFDSNTYPGDNHLAELRKNFTFLGYWLTAPPGSGDQGNTWLGKRAALESQGFGFLVLFNGRTEANLKDANASESGDSDGVTAAMSAHGEHFRPGTVIFLDQEEGGRLLPEQMRYVLSWISRVTKSGYRAGVYCSGIPVKDGKGKTITTAEDIREHAIGIDVKFFVYNDACPPSPGCVYGTPPPSESGTSFADVWQFAQSPRRKQYTARCSATYAKDGNCYPQGGPITDENWFDLDLDTATSADPSQAR